MKIRIEFETKKYEFKNLCDMVGTKINEANELSLNIDGSE